MMNSAEKFQVRHIIHFYGYISQFNIIILKSSTENQYNDPLNVQVQFCVVTHKVLGEVPNAQKFNGFISW